MTCNQNSGVPSGDGAGRGFSSGRSGIGRGVVLMDRQLAIRVDGSDTRQLIRAACGSHARRAPYGARATAHVFWGGVTLNGALIRERCARCPMGVCTKLLTSEAPSVISPIQHSDQMIRYSFD